MGTIDREDFDPEVFGLYADIQMTMLSHRRQLLVLSDEVMREVAGLCETHGVDPDALHREWINDALHVLAMYNEAVDDPDGHYRRWTAQRFLEPYRASVGAEMAAQRRLDLDAMRFNISIWNQEIAWAHRLRLSKDLGTVVLCDLFLRSARRDTVKQFNALVQAYMVESERLDYLRAREHDLTPDEIRAGAGSEKFGPLFLKHARVAFSKALDAVMERDDAERIAAVIRAVEEGEKRRLLRESTVRMIERGRMPRMPSVIRAAMEIGLDSDWLTMAHEAFLSSVTSGEVSLSSSGGLPHSEFLSWLRLQRFKRRPMDEGRIENGRNADMVRIGGDPKSWLSAIPDDYKSLGGEDVRNFHQWFTPVVSNKRTAPQDFVLDYGFHLVATTLRRDAKRSSGAPPRSTEEA